MGNWMGVWLGKGRWMFGWVVCWMYVRTGIILTGHRSNVNRMGFFTDAISWSNVISFSFLNSPVVSFLYLQTSGLEFLQMQ